MAWAAAGLLISKIASLVENEASLIGGIEDQLNELKDELTSMRSFLEDADKKRSKTAGEQSWVANVTAMVYDVEDIIDDFLYHTTATQDHIIYQAIHLPKKLYKKHQLAKKLEKINQKIKVISERRQRYGIDRVEGTISISNVDDDLKQSLADAAHFMKDDDLVGVEDDLKLIMGWLQDEKSELSVYSVVGLGGSGKTTLVAKAYNNKIVKQHFSCYAWITVSQKYDTKILLRSMIKEFHKSAAEPVPGDVNSLNCRELIEILKNYLGSKTYLLVLDDVWSIQLWTEINASLPNEGLGSRIILTSRREDVALFSFGIKSHVHRLNGLSKDHAWTLFSKKAFQQFPGGGCPQSLEVLAHELVQKCRGLPLAIVALAGVMSSKRFEREWRMIYNSLSSELSGTDEPLLESMKNILWLGVSDLPYPFKRCFLYCCLFPEDYDIIPERVIRLWIAEGFVEQVGNMAPEEVAETYLMGLVKRSMLQVVKRNAVGRLKRCRMHDLLRDIALSTSRMQKFCGIYDAREASNDTGVRRLQLFHTKVDDLKSWSGMTKLRSLLVFGHVGKISPASLALLLRTSRFLRVLDLQSAPIDKLPDELVDLFNLRYLNIRMTRVKELTNSIGRLENLETLDLRDTRIELLPNATTKLQNLRHLLTSCSEKLDMFQRAIEYNLNVGTRTPPKIWKLKNLQVLDRVQAEPDLMKGIRSMTQLRRFGITNLKSEHMEEVRISVENMNLLHFLHLAAIDGDEALWLNTQFKPPPLLEVLFLGGILKTLPLWLPSLQNLTSLTLHWSRLREDPLPLIQVLPNLEELNLNNAFVGTRLCFGAGFPKLRQLYLLSFHWLEQIVIERGAMPVLEILHVVNCMELKKVPYGVQYLTNLQELGLFLVPNEAVERLHGENSIDRSCVQHIPQIVLLYESASGLSYETLP